MKKSIFTLGVFLIPTLCHAGTITTYFGGGGGRITFSTATAAAVTPIVLTTSTAKSSVADTNGFTSPAVNTTGANFIAVALVYYNPDAAPTFADNKSNKYTQLNIYNANNFNTLTIYYSSNPVVGTGHTFTVTGNGSYACMDMQAFANVMTSANPFDQQNGAANASATTLQTGSVTPTTDNQLLFSGFTVATAGSTMSVNSGFTITEQIPDGGNNLGCAGAYLINGAGTSGAAVNPTWTNSGSAAQLTANIATFKVGP